MIRHVVGPRRDRVEEAPHAAGQHLHRVAVAGIVGDDALELLERVALLALDRAREAALPRFGKWS